MNKDELINILEKNKLQFKEYRHKEVFTVEESVEVNNKIPGCHTKNLFLKNKKKDFYLLSCQDSTRVDIKKFSKAIGSGNLSFANHEHLEDKLGVKPGSVSPFGLLNNISNSVNFFIDKEIYKQNIVNFHPLINTSTINMFTGDFINLLVENEKKINIYDFINNKSSNI